MTVSAIAVPQTFDFIEFRQWHFIDQFMAVRLYVIDYVNLNSEM